MSVWRGGAAGEGPGAASGGAGTSDGRAAELAAPIELGAEPSSIPEIYLKCSGQVIHRVVACQECYKMKCVICDLMSFCAACNKIMCVDCEPMGFCDICHKVACMDCAPLDFCDKCCRSAWQNS
jgi:hypothetical protein